MAYLPELHYCVRCKTYLGPDDGDGICPDCDSLPEEEAERAYNAHQAVGVGDFVRFAHMTEAAGRVSAESEGLLEIEGWSGLFAPHLFIMVPACADCSGPVRDGVKDGYGKDVCGPCMWAREEGLWT